MLLDFMSNMGRFLRGDWSNAGLVVKYWMYAKPTAAELATVKSELDAALMAASPDALLVRGILFYCHSESPSAKGERLAEAASCFQQAAVSHKAFAWQMLSFLYECGDTSELNYAQLKLCLEEILSRTDFLPSEQALAANVLGHLYDYGFGVVRDYASAYKYYARAAELGEVSALTNIGLLYEYGAGVTQDYTTAKKHYETAARANDAQALDRLGNLYEHGLGVEQNLVAAARCYRQAAQLGDVSAFNHLAFLYENGLGVPKEFRAAEDCYEKAVDLGDPHAAAKLVQLYRVARYGSFSIIRLDKFARSTLECREVNRLTAKILGGNFDDLGPEINRFLVVNSSHAVIRILVQLLTMVDYLLHCREHSERRDYQLRINDFWTLTCLAAQSKPEFEEYLAQHSLVKKSIFSDTYRGLRDKLVENVATATNEGFCQALCLYRQYLEFRKTQVLTSSEAEVLQQLCNSQVRPYAVGYRAPATAVDLQLKKSSEGIELRGFVV